MKLIVGNSECQIQGLSPKQLNELRELMSYEGDPQSAWFSGTHRSTRRYLMDKKGRFPSGLLYLFNEWAAASGFQTVALNDLRTKPNRDHALFSLRWQVIPYPDQVSAVEASVKASSGIIVAPTGAGKSVMMALLIKAMGMRTLVVVPNLELKTQLKQTFMLAFGSLNNITVENIGSPELKKHNNYDLLIIDEAHHSGAKTYRVLNKKYWSGIYHRVFFTATPFRSRDEERLLMESVTGKVVYRLTYADAIRKKYIVPLEAYYVDVPKTEIKGNENSWPAMYSELVVNNSRRNKLIGTILSRLSDKSTLCLVKEINHGNTLSAITGVPFASGESEETRRYILELALNERKALIGTTGIVGEGVDTKPVEYVVIAGLGKSKNAFMQQCGRALRTYPGKESGKVILFRDPSHKWALKHFKEQCRFLKEEYGVIPVKIDV